MVFWVASGAVGCWFISRASEHYSNAPNKQKSLPNTRISLTLIFTGPDSGLHLSTSKEHPEEFEEQLKKIKGKGKQNKTK